MVLGNESKLMLAFCHALQLLRMAAEPGTMTDFAMSALAASRPLKQARHRKQASSAAFAQLLSPWAAPPSPPAC